MVQWVKALVTNSNNLSLISGSITLKKKKVDSKKLPSDFNMQAMSCTRKSRHMHSCACNTPACHLLRLTDETATLWIFIAKILF